MDSSDYDINQPPILITVIDEHSQTVHRHSLWLPMPRLEEGDWDERMINQELPLLMRQWLVRQPTVGLMKQIEGMSKHLLHHRQLIPHFTCAIQRRLIAVWSGNAQAFDEDDRKEIAEYFLDLE